MTAGAKVALVAATLIFVIPVYYTLAFGRLMMNATESMEAHAFALFTWPRILSPGLVAAVKMPPVLARQFPGQNLYLAKRIVGVPGDAIAHVEGRICLRGQCFAPFVEEGHAVAALWSATRVPEGQIAIFGESADSLDSRYEIIGGIPVEDVIAVGFPIPFPHWSELKAWLE
ncbi:S26 family signal peptidase [Chachezhania sediminis]|uniref:S26 family signal peptidase n=1 Tax=Chachezhania sediminis TaxID=2599291 RepID=UPI00131C2617|nr:S26 family signal peptidase [Chachezhania sediminis]